MISELETGNDEGIFCISRYTLLLPFKIKINIVIGRHHCAIFPL